MAVAAEKVLAEPIGRILDRLDDLDLALRLNHFTIAPNRWISVHDLLTRLLSQGRCPDDPTKLGALIGPLLCSSPEQQRVFSVVFDKWLREEQAKPEPTKIQRNKPTEPEADKKLDWKTYVGVSIIALVLTLVASQFFEKNSSTLEKPGSTSQPNPGSDSGSLTDDGSSSIDTSDRVVIPRDYVKSYQPRNPEPIKLPLKQQELLNDAKLLILFLPFVLALYWLAVSLFTRKWFFRKERGSGTDPFKNFFFSAGASRPFWNGRIPAALHNLRRGAPIQTRKLDVDQTVDATIRNAGLLNPVKKVRNQRPEYLFLSDRRDAWDYTAGMSQSLVERMEQEDLKVYHFEYMHDPRVCYSTKQNRGQMVTLETLSRRFPDAQLLVAGDSAGVFSKYSKKPLKTLQTMSAWEGRAWFSTAPSPWGQFEQEISESGFAVAPLTSSGFLEVANWLKNPSNDSGGQLFDAGSHGYVPKMFRTGRSELLSEDQPESFDTRKMIRLLRQYLGEKNFKVVVATASFPILDNGLTIALDQLLNPGRTSEEHEKSIIKIGRLPWFRNKQMPDWVRLALLRDVSKSEREKIAKVFAEIFDQKNSIQYGGIELPLLLTPVQNPLNKLKKWYRLVGSTKYRDDRIFASVVMGRRIGALDIELPQKLAQWIPHNNWRVLAPLMTIALALVVSFLSFTIWTQWLEPKIQDELIVVARNKANEIPVTVAQTNRLVDERFSESFARALRGRGYKSAQSIGPQSRLDQANNTVEYFYEEYAEAAEDIADRLTYFTYGIRVKPEKATSPIDGVRVSLVERSQNLTNFRDSEKEFYATRIQAILGIAGPVQFSQNGELMVAASSEESLMIWRDKNKGEGITTIDDYSGQVIAGVAPGGDAVAIVDEDFNVKLWSVDKRVLLREFDDHTDSINLVRWSPNGDYIATASEEGPARFFSIAENESGLLGENNNNQYISFDSSGQFLVTSTLVDWVSVAENARTKLWTRPFGNNSFELDGYLPMGLGDVSGFNPDSSIIATVIAKPELSGNWLQFWSTESGQPIRRIDIGSEPELISSIVFSPRGDMIVTGTEYGVVKIWSAISGKHLHTLLPDFEINEDAMSIDFGSSGKIIATNSLSDLESSYIWTTDNAIRIQTLEEFGAVLQVDFNPQKDLLVTLSEHPDDDFEYIANIWKLVGRLQESNIPYYEDVQENRPEKRNNRSEEQSGLGEAQNEGDAEQARPDIAQTTSDTSTTAGSIDPQFSESERAQQIDSIGTSNRSEGHSGTEELENEGGTEVRPDFARTTSDTATKTDSIVPQISVSDRTQQIKRIGGDKKNSGPGLELPNLRDPTSKIKPGNSSPSIRVAITPQYPVSAQKEGLCGWVQLAYTVTAEGTVSNARVVSSSSKIFEQAALSAILRFRYNPRTVSGVAVDTSRVLRRINFQLDQGCANEL
ncbi:MAG: TonB family protein [Pseudomonadota bacterium]